MAPSEPATGHSPGQTLNGWKDIAAYLGKSVRSVQRWETELGLPVRRIKTPDGQIVYAVAAELEAWREQRGQPLDTDAEPDPTGAGPTMETDTSTTAPAPPVSSTFGLASRWFAGAALVTIAVIASVWLVQTSAPPTAVTFIVNGDRIEGIDARGQVVWSYRVGGEISPIAEIIPGVSDDPVFTHVGDLDGDGVNDVLVPIRHARAGGVAAVSDALLCFSVTGELKWRVAADQSLSFAGTRFDSPWTMTRLTVSDRGPRRIFVSYHHHTWWPAFVLEISASGAARLAYVQAGRIYALQYWSTPSGGMLAIGGANQEPREAMLVLVPDGATETFFSASTGPEFHCDHCGDGRPSKALLFDRNEFADAIPRQYPRVMNLQVIGADLKLFVLEGGTQLHPGSSFAMLTPAFEPASIEFFDGYWLAHREFERQGFLDHSAADCPERHRVRRIRSWTPHLGWTEQLLTPGSSHSR